jgi:16S rRNA C1402 N4-methylase RsmH
VISVLPQTNEKNINKTQTVKFDKRAPLLLSRTYSNDTLRKILKTSEQFNGVVMPLGISAPKLAIREVFDLNKLPNPIPQIV